MSVNGRSLAASLSTCPSHIASSVEWMLRLSLSYGLRYAGGKLGCFVGFLNWDNLVRPVIKVGQNAVELSSEPRNVNLRRARLVMRYG